MCAHPLVLVVDDDENFTEVISLKLKAEGVDVVLACNGEEGLEKAEGLTPDLILMDINMPGMMGTDVALAIKNNPKTRGVRVLFLSSLRDPWPGFGGDNKKISRDMGMEDFLSKTDDLDLIVGRIKSVLDL